jgi:hypothetical protein
MKEFIKKNFVILLAFLLPILLILVVAITTYIPSVLLSTKYNFIYTTCVDNNNYYPYTCNDFLQKKYSVVDSKLVVNEIDKDQDLNNNKIPDIKENYTARIFLHDTEKNESREISLQEAQSYILSGLLTSQDGVSVSWDPSYSRGCNDFFIFGGCGGSYYGYSLTKGKSHSKLNLINNSDRYYYQNNFQFLGWVLPGRN